MKIGAGVAYYGGKGPAHAESCRALLRGGVPVFAVRGYPYPEMARAEVLGEALDSGVDVLLIIDHDVVFSVSDALTVAEAAYSTASVVSATAGRPRPGKPSRTRVGAPGGLQEIDVKPKPWDPVMMNGCAFTAVPRPVLDALKTSEGRSYTNSARIGTDLSKNSRPVFSPWKKDKGTLFTPPIEEGVYCDPDIAFLCRVKELGFKIFDHHGISVQTSGASSYSIRIVNARAEKQKAHNIECNYAVCVPSFGLLDPNQQEELWALELAGVTIIEMNGCPHIDLARSELKRIAIDELGCDGVFFLDHDIMFRPIDLLSIVKEAEEKQDVVAGIYCMRKTAHALIGAPDIEIGATVGFFELGGVIPAHYSGLGFAAIPKAVFQALDEFFPELDGGFPGAVRPYFALDANGNFYAGEDVSFCSRVNGLTVKHIPGDQADGVDWELGRGEAPTKHKIWLDTRVRIFHRGLYDYGVEDHSFAVPRIAKLEAKHARTREEVRAVLRTVDELPTRIQERSIGVDESATAIHGGVEA